MQSPEQSACFPPLMRTHATHTHKCISQLVTAEAAAEVAPPPTGPYKELGGANWEKTSRSALSFHRPFVLKREQLHTRPGGEHKEKVT